jgi:Putative zinc-finger
MTHEQAVSTFASERYLLEEMTEPERTVFEEHYFSCVDCADDVRMGAVMSDGARAGLMGERADQSIVTDMTASDAWRRRTPAPRRWYQSAAIPWAVAATLAVVAGYQTFVGTPGRPLRQPQAVVPVTLRPASRGQEPRVVVFRDSSIAMLAVDVTSAVSGSSLPYTIRTATGSAIASGTIQTPQAGAPLLLLVPTAELSLPGRYVLSVGDAEYPFEVVTQ